MNGWIIVLKRSLHWPQLCQILDFRYVKVLAQLELSDE
jgi:hypothetical protein